MCEFCSNFCVEKDKSVSKLPIDCRCDCVSAIIAGKKGCVAITETKMGNKCSVCGHIYEEL